MTSQIFYAKALLATGALVATLAVAGCQKSHPQLTTANNDGTAITNSQPAPGTAPAPTATPAPVKSPDGQPLVGPAPDPDDMEAAAATNPCTPPPPVHKHHKKVVVVNRPPAPTAPPSGYVQPVQPAPDYNWTPGYWAWGASSYYWVPGVWVAPGFYYGPRYGYYGGWRGGWHGGYRGGYRGGFHRR